MTTSEARVEVWQGTPTGETHPEQPARTPFHESDYRLARQLRPVLYCQITQEPVSFDHIAKAWRIRNNPDKPVGKDEERASRVLEYLARRRFSAEHEGIQKDYWSERPWAGCALTGDSWIHSVMNSYDAELVLYENRIHQLCRDAHRTFEAAQRDEDAAGGRLGLFQKNRRNSREKAERDLKESGEMLYTVLTRVIGTASVLEDEHASQQQRDEALAAVRMEWKIVRTSVEGMIQRQARFEYFEGVGLGAAITISLLVGAGLLAAHFGANQFSEPGAFTAALIGGAMGAVISVTQRMTANTLTLDFAAPKHQKVLLGALRPLVGAVFAAVVYFTIIGGLLAVEARTGKDASVTLAFFAVAGFASGFSERFATDVLDRASSGVLPAPRDHRNVKNTDEPERLMAEQPRHVEGPAVTQQPQRTRALAESDGRPQAQ